MKESYLLLLNVHTSKLSLPHTHVHAYPSFHCIHTHSCTHAPSHTYPHTHPHTYTLTFTLAHTHSHTLTHSHTHIQALLSNNTSLAVTLCLNTNNMISTHNPSLIVDIASLLSLCCHDEWVLSNFYKKLRTSQEQSRDQGR